MNLYIHARRPGFIAVLLFFSMLLGPSHAEETQSGFSMPETAGQAQSTVFQSLKGWFGGDGQPELLPPDEAFKATLHTTDAKTMVAEFEPAEGYYLYRDKIKFVVQAPDSVSVAQVSLPRGDMKSDPTFGHVEVFRLPFEAVVSLNRKTGEAANGEVRVSYQGCSDLGVCYPPVEKIVKVAFPAVAPASIDSSVAGSRSAGTASSPATQRASWLDPDRSSALLEGASFAWVVAAFFGFGLLLSLTPCVWPMFPILSGIVAGQAASNNRSHAFWLSASYVLGMALTYAIAGVAAGLTGTLLSTALQAPWVLGAMAILFLVLALSMFGVYEIQLPSFLQDRIASTSNRPGRRAALGVFGMGALSAVIVGPCIAAPLAGALLYISQTQDVVLGGTALFAMALGKGVPLLLVGTTLGTWLPRSGPWMKGVKVFLGVLLLAAAVWTVAPILPLAATMALAGAILVAYAVYLRALDSLPGDASGLSRLGKGIGVIGLLIGAFYLVGAVSGGRDFLQPLAGLGGNIRQQEIVPLGFERISNVEEFEARLQSARGRYVMLDFYADWCVSCKEMEHFTFSDPAVRAKLENVLLLQADVTRNSAEDKQLLARFGLFGPPGIMFFDRSGQEIKGGRVIGFMNARRFARLLDELIV